MPFARRPRRSRGRRLARVDREGKSFDRKLWFSDTYVRAKAGWRYAFGQASLALPSEP